jgi:hypothetical protein
MHVLLAAESIRRHKRLAQRISISCAIAGGKCTRESAWPRAQVLLDCRVHPLLHGL